MYFRARQKINRVTFKNRYDSVTITPAIKKKKKYCLQPDLRELG